MKKIHLVSHVHWDPAWYLPYEQYRITLIPLMKRLLDILDNSSEYHSFMFDGQIDAIDDYLAIVPDDTERIKKHVRSGRLIIGPWYIQPEEFMISGETHIRNMLIGIKKAKDYGGCMPITYLCDMVGHIPQMPQLVKGFNMDYFVGWRGILNGGDRDSAEHIWQAPDGSCVLMKVLTNGYYNILPDDEEGFIKKLDELCDILAPFERSDYLLVMQGADHNMPIGNIPGLIRAYNKAKGFEAAEHTTLLKHFEAIRGGEYSTVTGEFRAMYHPAAFILTGILSARMKVKLENERLAMELERWTEPFASIDTILTGAAYPKELLSYAWIKQLKNSFHDCIYGAHVDSVTKDIFNDYKRTDEITRWVNNESLHSISKCIKTRGSNITVFNPTPRMRENEVVDFEYFDKDGSISGFVAEDGRGNVIPVQLCGIERDVRKYTGFSNNQWKQCDPEIGCIYKLSVRVPVLPALGYANLTLRRGSAEGTDLIAGGRECENTYLKIRVNEKGYVDIFDKKTQTLYRDMNIIEDGGDAGDLYNYSVPKKDKILRSGDAELIDVSIVSQGPSKVTFRIEQRLQLPEKIENFERTDRTVANTVVTEVTLRSCSQRVEFRVIIDNQSEDHRYRAVFPTGIASENVDCGSQFYVISRPTRLRMPETYIEKPMNNYPDRLFADCSDGKRGVTFINRGLPEYEAQPDGTLYITLLRCVGYLSKETLEERFYNGAGPQYPTPDAQEKGRFEAEYALYFHEGDWKSGEVCTAVDEFYAVPKVMQGDEHDGELPPEMSFIDLQGEGIMLSAVKQSESGDKWVIRLYNILDCPVSGTLRLFKPVKKAYKANLNEDAEYELPCSDDGIVLSIGKHQIYTVLAEV